MQRISCSPPSPRTNANAIARRELGLPTLSTRRSHRKCGGSGGGAVTEEEELNTQVAVAESPGRRDTEVTSLRSPFDLATPAPLGPGVTEGDREQGSALRYSERHQNAKSDSWKSALMHFSSRPIATVRTSRSILKAPTQPHDSTCCVMGDHPAEPDQRSPRLQASEQPDQPKTPNLSGSSRTRGINSRSAQLHSMATGSEGHACLLK
ncbi:hypothetical protein AAFF_G00341150 [Aldrovandia affinis]|uniref:Uncharacterized protein n=1 Tax=Aldrovandia affinis TaxID=143900 RepID=A0AAD7SKK3_9TELE|nr:hypothetical protein AAFF_G00341150 [Aldrovandia affinis]